MSTRREPEASPRPRRRAPSRAAALETQLRLVESPRTKTPTRRARTNKIPRSRRAHWAADWQLDADTRRLGRAGVQAARTALAQAQARATVSDLPRAS